MSALSLLDPADPAAAPWREAALRLRERVFVLEQGVPLELEHDAHDATAWHAVLVDGGEVVATRRRAGR